MRRSAQSLEQPNFRGGLFGTAGVAFGYFDSDHFSAFVVEAPADRAEGARAERLFDFVAVGDVVAFDLRLWHASCGGSRDRHMCTVVYYANPKTPAEAKALRDQGAGNVRAGLENFRPKRHYLYSRAWMANPRGSAARRGWIDRLSELGYFDAPGVVEAL